MYSREIKQLMGMGLPRSRARAAIIACKGDAMGAAARAFSGDFDDVPSDDEDEDMEDTVLSCGQSKAGVSASKQDSDDGGESLDNSDDEDDVEDFVYEDNYDPMATDDAEGLDKDGNVGADPWAGVFTAKDRVEEIIEVRDGAKVASVVLPGSAADGTAKRVVICKTMTISQWMSGCPEGGEQGHLFQIYNMLSAEPMECSGQGCTQKYKRKAEDCFAMFDDWADTLVHLRHTLPRKCPKCSAVTCVACGQPSTASAGKSPAAPYSPSDPLMHCVNIQPVVLGLGLFQLQKQFGQAPSADATSSSSKTGQKRKQSTPLSSEEEWSSEEEAAPPSYPGTPKSSKKAKGTGYGGQGHEDRSWQDKGAKAQKAQDEKMTALLKQVRPFLPSHWRETGEVTSDSMPHPATLAHLRRRFGEIATTLLRNDALHEHADRADLFLEIQEWLIIIARHESLAAMLAMPHMRPSKVKMRKVNGSKETVTTYEASASVRELLESVKEQCESYIVARAAEERRMDKQDEADLAEGKEISDRMDAEAQKVLEYAKTVISSLASIDRALEETKGSSFMRRLREALHPSSSGVVANEISDLELQEAYVNWAKKNSLDYVDLKGEPAAGASKDKITYQHVFAKSIIDTKSALPKRSAVISKELATLKLHLPSSWGSSVFLRVDEERIDVMKALITGPEDTPYMNTPLIFDIFLPYDYNHSPPMCKIITTYGGRYRLNPNLYAEGKVCLSLLGTWTGPGWQSGKSTLLQVLLSIQSLILVSEPIANEPHYESQSKSSKAYNANVRRMCVKLMLEYVKSPPFPFEEVIKTHFKLKGPSILKQLDVWESEDDGKGTVQDSMTAIRSTLPKAPPSAAFKKDLDDLRAKLSAKRD